MSVYDLKPIYKYGSCDGDYFRRTVDDRILMEMTDLDAAVLFEIGHYM